MITESRIKAIEDRLDELTKSFLQAQKNQVPLTTKIDDASGKIPILDEKVANITPYTQTKTAYIDDTEVVFENAPSGNISITWDKPDFATDSAIFRRDGNTVVIEFAPLEEVKQVTISII